MPDKVHFFYISHVVQHQMGRLNIVYIEMTASKQKTLNFWRELWICLLQPWGTETDWSPGLSTAAAWVLPAAFAARGRAREPQRPEVYRCHAEAGRGAHYGTKMCASPGFTIYRQRGWWLWKGGGWLSKKYFSRETVFLIIMGKVRDFMDLVKTQQISW